jgi:twitching motility protein PilT
MTQVHDWLSRLRRISGSALLVSTGRAPLVRAAGELAPLPGGATLGDAELRSMLQELAGAQRWSRFEREHDLDFALELEDGARFVVHCFEHLQGVGAVMRAVPAQVPTLEALGAPETLRWLAGLASGLVVVAGPAGSGKSTTLAALVDAINRTQSRHVVTLARPIEIVQANAHSVVSHREIGSDSEDAASALRAALRQDADVVVVDDLDGADAVALALESASKGPLVLVGVRASDAIEAVEGLLGMLPPAEREQARNGLALSLAAVVFQVLVPGKAGKRVAAHEILVRSPTLEAVVRTGRAAAPYAASDAERALGMQTLDDALLGLVAADAVELDEAASRAVDKRALRRQARGAG